MEIYIYKDRGHESFKKGMQENFKLWNFFEISHWTSWLWKETL